MRKIALPLSALLLISITWVACQPMVRIPALRQPADQRGFRIGVTDAGFGTTLYENTIPYAFNSLTPESVMKFENIHPCPPTWLIENNANVAAWVREHGADRPESSRHCTLENAAADEWEWESLDDLLFWARENDIGFRGHTFLWHTQNPGWLTDESISLTIAESQRVMTEHIQTAIAHTCTFANLYAYDVVNEAIQPDGTLIANPWSSIPDYIDLAFRTARQATTHCGRPEIKLYYNDNGFEYGEEKADAIYAYLANLLLSSDPTPIDGIGFQTHSQTIYSNKSLHQPAALTTTLDRFANGLGLETAITETDLPIATNDRPTWYDEQGRWFGERLQACLSAARCVGYTLWGTHDGASWRVYFKGDLDPLAFYDANEMVFDPDKQQCVTPGAAHLPGNEQFCPKPAYFSLAKMLTTP